MEKTPFPNSFDLIALYGRNTGYSDESDDCRIYHLNNETGAGTITIYHVFQGIQAAFNDIHMAYCNLQQNTASNMIEISTAQKVDLSAMPANSCAATWHPEIWLSKVPVPVPKMPAFLQGIITESASL